MKLLNQITGEQTVHNMSDLVALFPAQFSNRRVHYDAHEFMVYLRDIFQGQQRMLTSNEVKALQDIQQPRTCFKGILTKVKTCMSCSFEAPKIYEEFEDLSIPLATSPGKSPLNLRDLLTDFLKDDIVQMKCQICNPLINVDFSLRTAISLPPRILTINLKRSLHNFTKSLQQVVCSDRLYSRLIIRRKRHDGFL